MARHSILTRLLTVPLAFFLTLTEGALLPAQTYIGPVPYTSATDSPFTFVLPATFLEDLEDTSFDLPGVSFVGTITVPGVFTDSVDGDDGVIDGFGTAGRSLFNLQGPTGITLTFDPATLGGYPSAVGIVWTDGEGDTSFEAFDANGVSLGVHGPFQIADGRVDGTTGEDRFFGVQHAAGISSVVLSNTQGGIEADHVQFYADGFLLTASRNRVRSGDVVILTSSGGEPFQKSLLAVVAVSGAPTFVPLIFSNFDATGVARHITTVPPGLAGLSIGLQSIGAAAGGKVRLSNLLTMRLL